MTSGSRGVGYICWSFRGLCQSEIDGKQRAVTRLRANVFASGDSNAQDTMCKSIVLAKSNPRDKADECMPPVSLNVSSSKDKVQRVAHVRRSRSITPRVVSLLRHRSRFGRRGLRCRLRITCVRARSSRRYTLIFRSASIWCATTGSSPFSCGNQRFSTFHGEARCVGMKRLVAANFEQNASEQTHRDKIEYRGTRARMF